MLWTGSCCILGPNLSGPQETKRVASTLVWARRDGEAEAYLLEITGDARASAFLLEMNTGQHVVRPVKTFDHSVFSDAGNQSRC